MQRLTTIRSKQHAAAPATRGRLYVWRGWLSVCGSAVVEEPVFAGCTVLGAVVWGVTLRGCVHSVPLLVGGAWICHSAGCLSGVVLVKQGRIALGESACM